MEQLLREMGYKLRPECRKGLIKEYIKGQHFPNKWIVVKDGRIIDRFINNGHIGMEIHDQEVLDYINQCWKELLADVEALGGMK